MVVGCCCFSDEARLITRRLRLAAAASSCRVDEDSSTPMPCPRERASFPSARWVSAISTPPGSRPTAPSGQAIPFASCARCSAPSTTTCWPLPGAHSRSSNGRVPTASAAPAVRRRNWSPANAACVARRAATWPIPRISPAMMVLIQHGESHPAGAPPELAQRLLHRTGRVPGSRANRSRRRSTARCRRKSACRCATCATSAASPGRSRIR